MQERALFLFNDLLLIAKERNSSHFKLKDQVMFIFSGFFVCWELRCFLFVLKNVHLCTKKLHLALDLLLIIFYVNLSIVDVKSICTLYMLWICKIIGDFFCRIAFQIKIFLYLIVIFFDIGMFLPLHPLYYESRGAVLAEGLSLQKCQSISENCILHIKVIIVTKRFREILR